MIARAKRIDSELPGGPVTAYCANKGERRVSEGRPVVGIEETGSTCGFRVIGACEARLPYCDTSDDDGYFSIVRTSLDL